MNIEDLNSAKQELSVKAKNGIDFILAAGIIWILIAYIWTWSIDSYNKSVVTFIVGSLLLPFALIFSKLLKTNWKVPNNPLQPLGLWLNFAQLFYFPFLIWVLIKSPDYFVMTYMIITGAHLFPYAWYYKSIAYAIMAGITAWGALLLSFTLPLEKMYVMPLTMSSCLFILAFFLRMDYKRKKLTIQKLI